MNLKKSFRLFAQKTIFKVFSVINKYIKKEKQILIYSPKELSDNSLSLFEHLIDNEYYTKYKIYCSCTDYHNLNLKYKNLKNVYFINGINGILKYFTSSFVFYSFGKIPIIPFNQRVVQMWHGMFFKDIDKYQKKIVKKEKYYTDVIVTSEMFKELATKVHSCDIEVVKICGQSRTDVFFNGEKKVTSNYIVWLPTFRQSEKLGYSDTNSEEILIGDYSFEELKKVNNLLKEDNLNMIVKLHPLQTLPAKMPSYSNIQILSEENSRKKNIKLYELLRDSKALITDYSSVFYDYYLLDKPIAFCIRDFDDYNKNRGFMVEKPMDYLKGNKIKSLDDMCNFINEITHNVDKFKEERREFNEKVNKYRDGNNSKRLLEKIGIN